MPKDVFVVSHTHWDREWYRSVYRFRLDLLDVVSDVLHRLENDDAFRHFLLDGQTIILEDYLRFRSQDRERIGKLVQAGALAIGPWYILPDEFLVSGEATVRNLLIGHNVARDLGGVQKVGYMPDAFGHIAQMPQILKQAEIDSFVYTRGNGDEMENLGAEYHWMAPDGSWVLAVHQIGGYCNAGALGFQTDEALKAGGRVDVEQAVEKVRALLSRMDPFVRSDKYLLNNGCDHLPPQPELDAIVRALQDAFPEREVKQTSLGEYLDAVRSSGAVRQVYAGELLGGKHHLILSGVWSTRMYLKQLNDRAQTLLSCYLEPLAALNSFMRGQRYPQAEIEQAWKLLLQNHPHDSICGCSIDEVHRQMVPRFEGVIETAEHLASRTLRSLAASPGSTTDESPTQGICLFNPLPRPRTEVVERLFVISDDAFESDRLTVIDERGATVVFEITAASQMQRFWSVDYGSELFVHRQRELFESYQREFPERIVSGRGKPGESERFVMLRFLAESVPGVGHANYSVREGASHLANWTTDEYEPIVRSDGVLANEFCEVHVHPNGTFDVMDTSTEHWFRGLNLLEDGEDIGDEYDHAPCSKPTTITAQNAHGSLRVADAGRLRGVIEVQFDVALPERIEKNRQARSTTLVSCPVLCRIGLSRHSPIVDVDLVFANRVRDHRLRAAFPTDIRTDEVISDGHFYINHRPIQRPTGQDWVQPAPPTYPQQDFTLVQDGTRGLALLNSGLPEFEPVGHGSGAVTLILTLLRCVGWLSRDDLDTRRHRYAGPMLPTPEAQCLGQQRFRYGVVPFPGDYLTANIKGLAERFKAPMIAVQAPANQSTGSGLVTKRTHQTAITAIKRHVERDTLVVRLYNVTSNRVTEVLSFGRDVANAWRVNLLEERQQELSVKTSKMIELELEPHKIVTLEIAFD